MKKFKKIFAVMLSLAMVLGMSLTTFAAGTQNNDGKTPPSASDEAPIKITGIASTETPTIKAYRIVEPEYVNGVGLSGYKVVDGYSIADNKNFVPTATEIVDIAKKAANKTAESVTFDKVGNDYVAYVGAGEYLIIIESTNYTYNPMVVSAAYVDANDADSLAASGVALENSSVDANANWALNGTSNAFAKSSQVKVEKMAPSSAEVGGTVTYTITGTIPSYSGEYTNPKYTVNDVYTNLTDVGEPTVSIGGNPATKGEDGDYTVGKAKDSDGNDIENSFSIDFKKLSNYAGMTKEQRAVVITYTAKIANTALVTNPATNEATLNYTHKPNEEKDADPADTNTYTFNIETLLEKKGEGDDANALENATFTLYRGITDEVVRTYKTKKDADGKTFIKFAGLAEDTYTMKETVAPAGYSINEKVYTIKITNLRFDKTTNDKQLESYTVEVTEGTGTPKVYVYTKQQDGSFSVDNSTVTVVQNTKLSSLPSTGGIGTTIFTIGGCAIMIIAAGLFFASRRKSSK